jgi:hypothetical protein
MASSILHPLKEKKRKEKKGADFAFFAPIKKLIFEPLSKNERIWQESIIS